MQKDITASWIPKGAESQIPTPPIPIPWPIWEVLYRRGFQTKEELDQFFSPSLSQLKDPFLLLGMQKACERIAKALHNNETIAIYADFDLDGTSGLCLLYEGLTQMGFQNIFHYQPKRLSEGYGLHVHAVEELAEKKCSVIITVDVGITALPAAKRAKELGVDLIITDHHLPYEELPDAFVIVNPNQKDCTSGLKYLSGAGVAFYLLLALRSHFKKESISYNENYSLKELLDYFIIGTLTDMVPVIEENRALIKHGLHVISKTKRAGLKALIETLNMGNRFLTSQDVAIMIAPKLNALSRMECDLLPREVMLETDGNRAQLFAHKILETQNLRKQYQKKAVAGAEELKVEMNQQGYIWVWSHEFHKGVIGLVATNLAQKYFLPCFVGSINELGEVSGSCRAPEGLEIDLTQVLDGAKDVLKKYGGHAMAAGFSLDVKNVLALDEALNNYFSSKSILEKKTLVEYDSELSLEALNSSFMSWYESLEPFGKEFSVPSFCLKNLRIKSIKNMNGGHLKIYWEQDGKSVESVMFSPQKDYSHLKENMVCDILAEPKWNYFRDNKTIQLFLKDIRLS